jgi:A/G-specific adenine glycosylase
LSLTSPRRDDARFAAELVAWFQRGARELPWRTAARDPYAVWISEVMLQQTRVETVIPYFERFLARFPTTRALADAAEADVLALWSGLGYYRRARALHATAREVVERFGGALPASADALRALGGVGPYTAGAVASIAFDLPEALVDGNVARVLARVEAIDAAIDGAAGRRLAWEAARRRVPLVGAGRYNEALMELGATVCTPRAPRCEACPVAKRCRANIDGRVDELPKTTPKRAVKLVELTCAVLVKGARVLLGQRARAGLFAGLWEPPMVEARTLAAARPKLRALGVPGVEGLRSAGRVEHTLTHRRLAVLVATGPAPARARTPSLAHVVDGDHAYGAFAWADPTDGARGVSTLTRKILKRAGLG